MGSESSLWKTVSKHMKGRWEADRIENSAALGTPDVYYTLREPYMNVMGWLELKYVHEWPVRACTPMKIPHFTPQQRLFIQRHFPYGCNVKLLLQVARDYILLEGDKALLIDTLTKQGLFDAGYHWQGKIDYDTFSFILQP